LAKAYKSRVCEKAVKVLHKIKNVNKIFRIIFFLANVHNFRQKGKMSFINKKDCPRRQPFRFKKMSVIVS